MYHLMKDIWGGTKCMLSLLSMLPIKNIRKKEIVHIKDIKMKILKIKYKEELNYKIKSQTSVEKGMSYYPLHNIMKQTSPTHCTLFLKFLHPLLSPRKGLLKCQKANKLNKELLNLATEA